VEDLPFELPEDRPPELLLELASSLIAKALPKVTGAPLGDSTMPPSTGAHPSAMVARKRAMFIVLSGQTVCTRQPARGAQTGKRRNTRQPASHMRRRGQTALSTNDEPYRGRKNENFGILVCPDFRTQPIGQTPNVGRFDALTLTAVKQGPERFLVRQPNAI